MNGYNFTENLRRALSAAREHAGRLRHEFVGPEHVLLGLLSRRNSVAGDVLTRLGIDATELQQAVEAIVKPGTNTRQTPDLPYTSRAKKILELAMTAAREGGQSYVGTEHVLLGVLREENGIGAQVLAQAGVTVEAVAAVLPEILGQPSRPEEVDVAGYEPPAVDHHYEVHTYEVTDAPRASGRMPAVLLLLGFIALAASRINAYESGTWLLEVFPIFLAVPLLIATRKRFPLTPLVYGLIFIHALILMLGGHYTYARVPLGFWMQDAFHFARNHYDRIGHFAQGFVLAIIAREILVRKSPLHPGKWLFVLVTCVCLSVSVGYEFIEWAAAIMGGSSVESFLGTQGDVWDTQWDMFMTLLGAVTAQLLLSRVHDRQLVQVRARQLRRP